jgi:hypothetical protein
MKKFLFFLITIATLISCQEDLIPEVVNEQQTDVVNKSEILDLVNYNRTVQCEYVLPDGTGVLEYTDVKNLVKLKWNDDLFKAAEIQSLHMFNTGEFAHIWKDGTSPTDRLQMITTINYSPIGENIAHGYTDEKSVINAWFNSDGHRKNMLNNGFNIIAVARKGNYWTMVLGYKV